MAELKEVKVFHYVIEELQGLFRTSRLEVHDGDDIVGYYRIWHDKETENIAFYAEKDKHGVLAPGEYKAIPTNHKLIGLIEKDLNLMGYTIPDGHKVVTDAMLIGDVKFPTDWAGWKDEKLDEINEKDIFKINKSDKEEQ